MPELYSFFQSTLSFLPDWLLLVLAVVIPCSIAFGLIQAVAGGSTYVERKIAADIQRRVGPNKCNIGSFLGEFARQTVQNAKGPNAHLGAKVMAALLGPALPLLNLVDKLLIKLAPGVLIFLADGIK